MRRYSGIIILVLFIVAIFLPVDVPYTLESVAKVMPVREWILNKRPDGSLTMTLHDHRNGQLQEAGGYQFDRGDQVHIDFIGADSIRQYIDSGEVVAIIHSNDLNEELVVLRNQLLVEEANLDVVSTGEKEELIAQLKEEVKLARENLALQRKLYDRADTLVKDGVIAQVEWETAENAYEAAVLRVQVAKEALRVADTGEKEETVSLVSSRIESLRQQIAFLENTQNQYVLAAPFDGGLRYQSTLDGEKLILEDTSASILVIPIKVRDSRYVEAGQEIEVKFPDNEHTLTSSVLEVGSSVGLIGREQVVTVKAYTRTKDLPVGMPLRCNLHCGKVRIKEFLTRSIQW